MQTKNYLLLILISSGFPSFCVDRIITIEQIFYRTCDSDSPNFGVIVYRKTIKEGETVKLEKFALRRTVVCPMYGFESPIYTCTINGQSVYDKPDHLYFEDLENEYKRTNIQPVESNNDEAFSRVKHWILQTPD